MASTYSTNLALELIGTGEQSGTWGTTTNTNLGTLLEQAISGYVTQAITDGSGANTTITIPNGSTGVARNMFIEMTGALTFATTSLIVPANKKMYFIFNNTSGGFAVTVKVSGQTGILVPNGKKVVLVSNGTDIVEAHTAIVGNATMGGTLGVTGATSVTTLAATGAITNTLSTDAVFGPVVTNANAGTSAQARFVATNGTSTATFGILGTGFGTSGQFIAGRGVLLNTGTSMLYTVASGSHIFSSDAGVNATGAIVAGATSVTTLSASGQTDLTLGGSATPSVSNTALKFSSSATAANYAGMWFRGSTSYNQFFGRVPTALSGTTDGVAIATDASGFAITQLWTNTGTAITGTLGVSGIVTLQSSTNPNSRNLATKNLIYNEGTAGNAGIEFKNLTSGNLQYITIESGDVMTFNAGAGQKFVYSGGTKLETTSAGAAITGTLGVTGIATSTTRLAVGNTGTADALTSYTSTGGVLYMGLDNSAGSALGTAGAYGTVIYRPASTGFAISRAGTADLSISSTGAVTIPGTLGVSGVGAIGTTTSSTTNLNLPAGTTGVSSLRIAHGVAPSAPVNGDMWSTTGGAFMYINGVTTTLSVSAASQADQETATSTTTYVSPGRQQYHPSAAKAWIKYESVSASPVIKASYNVSSLTDNGTGNITVNFTTAFSSAEYCAVSSGAAVVNNGWWVVFGSATAGGCTLRQLSNGSVPVDDTVNAVFLGDQ